MVNALLLLLAAAPFQQKVEKIPLKYVQPSVIASQLRWVGPYASLPAGIEQIVADPTDNSLIVKGEANAIAALRTVIAKFDVEGVTETVALNHVSASYVVGIILAPQDERQRGFLPEGVIISADEPNNCVVVLGPEQSVREAVALLKLLDTPPATVHVEIIGNIPSIGRKLQSSSDIVNNSLWTYADATSALQFSARPRINGDGSVTFVLTGAAMGSDLNVAALLKTGETLYVKVAPRDMRATNRFFVNSFARSSRLDEEAFLRGDPLSTLDPDLIDRAKCAPGELRLIVRAKVVSD